MTEPLVASSDATNMQATVEEDGDRVVLNGRKWYISGATDPRCKVAIFMGRSVSAIATGAPRHKQHAMVLVPLDVPGVKVSVGLFNRHLSIGTVRLIVANGDRC